jgi:phosphate transport system protein
MSRLERNYAAHLEALSAKILQLGGLVEHAIECAVRALVDRDADLAREVIERDREVDMLELEIDQLAVETLARFQPAAGDLRFITTAMQITPDLERMGDLASNVCERALELMEEPPLKPLVDIPAMAARAQEMLHRSLDAFVSRDPQAARHVITLDDELDHRMESVFRELVSYMLEDPRNITRAIRLTFVAKYLERIGDQSTNICELVVYLAEGKVIKHPRLTVDGKSPSAGEAG